MSNSEPVEELVHTLGTTARSIAVNTTTKDELLCRAKAAIQVGDQSMHDAAEALGVAQELHGVTQAEMALAVGKSEAWVSLLLRWRRLGYKEESPFGPRTKAGRLKHAKDRVASGAAKPSRRRMPKAPCANTTSNGPGLAVSSNACAPISAEMQKSITAPQLADSWSPAKAKGELMFAIKQWWRFMDDAGKSEVIEFFCELAGVRRS